MTDLRNFFNKNMKKESNNSSINEDSKKVKSKKSRSHIIVSSSDEDPLPSPISLRKRRAVIISDEEATSPPKKIEAKPESSLSKKKKTTNIVSENLYNTINNVEKININYIDPVSYFGSQPVNAPSVPAVPVEKLINTQNKKRKIEKSKKYDVVVTPKTLNDSTVVVSESNYDDDFIDDPKKTTSKSKEKSDGRNKGFTAENKPNFIKALQRSPPKMIGKRSIPVGAKNCLEGLTFVITGILEYIEREDATSLVRRYGGKVTTTVSGKTSYLISGREPGESKTKIAREKNTPIITEDQFFDMISSTKPAVDESVSLNTTDFDASCVVEEALVPHTIKDINIGESLWVDKYKPTCVEEIVGQHGNKSPANKLLRWLSDWFSNRKSTEKKNFFAAKEDGSIFRAALLSGVPGVGKSTTANICSKQLGFEVTELNASDMRSKKCLEAILSVSLQNFRICNNDIKTKAVFIMDEVDGMSGNEDRGGIQHLIGLIKTTNIPIICICNDRNHPKIRSLSNYCFDLRFPKPRVDQIKTFLLDIAKKESLTMDPQAAEQIVQATHSDIRQVLNNLQMWSVSKKTFGYDDSKIEASKCEKDIKENLFDVAKKIFTLSSTSKMSITEKSDLFFFDYNIIPLFVFENYLSTVTRSSGDKHKFLSDIARTANSISYGGICESYIRTYNAWSLLPTQAIFSCVIPCEYMSGVLGGMVNFPKWLGSNSTTNKNHRILQSLTLHTQLKCRSSKMALNLDYLPYLHNYFYDPLVTEGTDSINGVIRRVLDYDMTRDDYDNVIEYSQWNVEDSSSILTKTKSAFTRNLNKVARKLPYSLASTTEKKTNKVNILGDEMNEDPNSVISSSADEEEDLKANNMIKQVATPIPKKTNLSKKTRKVNTK